MSLNLKNLSYRYPTGEDWAVSDINLEIAGGEIVLLTGPTGCGKSTLLRLATGLLLRHGQGEWQGEIQIGGQNIADLPPSERVKWVGFVSQEPRDQVVAGRVGDEVAFAMESAGLPPAGMDERIAELLDWVGLKVQPQRKTSALSGGQTQRLTVAAALSAGAHYLVLDEPLSQLDPQGAKRLMAGLSRLAQAGMAILVVEHRLEMTFPHITRLICMESGRICLDKRLRPPQTPSEGAIFDPAASPKGNSFIPYPPHLEGAVVKVGGKRADMPSVGSADGASAGPGDGQIVETFLRLGLTLPGALALRLAQAERLPAVAGKGLSAMGNPPPGPLGPVILRAEHLNYRHDKAWALKDIALTLSAGERVALIGDNGAGKSTLLGAISGYFEGGRVEIAGRVVAVPQEPDLSLFCPDVYAELAYGPRESGLNGPALQERVEKAAKALSIEPFLQRAPHSLSRGQRLRVAVAAALTCVPELLILDEPTSGQDDGHIHRMMDEICQAMTGGALLFATHDLDLALTYATRVIYLREGEVVKSGPTATVLAMLREMGAVKLPEIAETCHQRGLPLVSLRQFLQNGGFGHA